MATPRIFVSSTCYDLQEVRFQLRNFINEYGYESVLSEFDDIFYSYDKHVQDSCLEEIPKCQLFILVVGNNYGSFYHKESQLNKTPDSVTLKEFRRALDHNISKHIFINKYVDYDYKNYKRALDKDILRYFKENDVNDNEVTTVRLKIKEHFDNKYHFPNDTYKYVFYFLEIVYELNEGNAISIFESFNDIKDSLKKQWAGLIYEALTKKQNIVSNEIHSLNSKIDSIEKNILKILQAKHFEDDEKISFNVSSIVKEVNIEQLEQLQEKVQVLLYHILNEEIHNSYGDYYTEKRIFFKQKSNYELVKKWLQDLGHILKSYKWSRYINVENLFIGFPILKTIQSSQDVIYKNVLELSNIYNSISEEDKDSFVNTVCQYIDNNYENPKELLSKSIIDEDADLPF